ncbi:helix-turn-helix transcriptional regulator [Mucilaginibacter sp.]|uniref:helix-turn-helix domain-containing protein n=1 Tax=Mucilaginibacter sp. TaxID=1882438 RepID=UPI0025E8DD0C|nr:helix-turn-helix transcriptional regulator [Mucilaginibacter sp.]
MFPQTLGDFIRKKRVESLQLQSEVARIIGVSEDTITNWETNRFVPQINLYPAIFLYLGYYPFTHETETIGGKVKQLRNCLGLPYEAAGEIFAVYATTVRGWELNKNHPTARKRLLIQARFDSLPDFLKNKTTQYERTEKIHITLADVLQ